MKSYVGDFAKEIDVTSLRIKKIPAPKRATLIARNHHHPIVPLLVVEEPHVDSSIATTPTPNEKKASDIIQP